MRGEGREDAKRAYQPSFQPCPLEKRRGVEKTDEGTGRRKRAAVCQRGSIQLPFMKYCSPLY